MQHRLGKVLAELLEHFLEGGEDFVSAPSLVTDGERATLINDVQKVMLHPLNQHVKSRRLAFADSAALQYPASEQQVESLIRSRTTVLQSLELSNGTIGDIATAVEKRFARPSGVSAYLSSPHSNAFDWHVDHWDSVVLQLEGRKLFHFSTGCSGGALHSVPQASVTLEPGDGLLFRMNTMHKTETIDPSVHLSLSVRP